MRCLFLCIVLGSCFVWSGALAGQSACLSMAKTPAVYGNALLHLKQDMEQKLESCGDYGEFHFNYGYLLERLRKYHHAISQYQEAIEINPLVAKYYFGLADVLRATGDLASAVSYYEKGLALNGENFRALRQLQKAKVMMASLQPVAVIRMAPPRRIPVSIDVEAPLQPAPPSHDGGMCRYDNFAIDRYEVSVAAYRKENPMYRAPAGFKDNMPVVNISYAEAEAFAQRQGKRLCSAREWQLAAAGSESDLRGMNLHKDYYSTPYAIDFGTESREVKNLIGNVAEWVQGGRKPAFIGGHYASDLLLQNSYALLSTAVTSEGDQGLPYVGLRCCLDVP